MLQGRFIVDHGSNRTFTEFAFTYAQQLPTISVMTLAAGLGKSMAARQTSTRVFMNDEFLYGKRSRGVAGYAFWQTAFASREPLTHESFADARKQVLSIRGDGNRPLNIVPNLLVVPPSLETAADEIILVERRSDGATNTQRGKATVLMTPWLTDEAA